MYFMQDKVALILEGGAMRGAFSKGVLDCFRKEKIEFSYVVGVSAGAITGFEFVTKIDFDINKLFFEFSKNISILRSSASEIDLVKFVESIFKFPPLKKLEKTKFEIVATSLVDGSVKYFDFNESKNIYDVVKKVMASSSLPEMAKSVIIDNIPYYDGGMYNTNPIQRAIDLGYEKFVVVLTRNRGYRRKNVKLSNVLKNDFKEYPKFLETMSLEKERYNNSLDLVDKLEKEKKAIVYAPVSKLKFNMFTTEFNEVKELYNEGYKLALETIEKVKKL